MTYEMADDRLAMFKAAGAHVATMAVVRRRDMLIKTSAATVVILKYGTAEEKRLVKEAGLPLYGGLAGGLAGALYGGFGGKGTRDLSWKKRLRRAAMYGAGGATAGAALGWGAPKIMGLLGRGAAARGAARAAKMQTPGAVRAMNLSLKKPETLGVRPPVPEYMPAAKRPPARVGTASPRFKKAPAPSAGVIQRIKSQFGISATPAAATTRYGGNVPGGPGVGLKAKMRARTARVAAAKDAPAAGAAPAAGGIRGRLGRLWARATGAKAAPTGKAVPGALPFAGSQLEPETALYSMPPSGAGGAGAAAAPAAAGLGSRIGQMAMPAMVGYQLGSGRQQPQSQMMPVPVPWPMPQQQEPQGRRSVDMDAPMNMPWMQ